MSQPSQLERLVGLAKESSSEQRRTLLREVTDLFMTEPEVHSPVEIDHFGQIMGKLACAMETEVRKELSQRMAGIDQAPHDLVKQLAHDEIAVARPVVSQSTVLTDDDLVEIAGRLGQEHLMAMTKRKQVSAAVGDAVIARGNDRVLVSLARNKGAQLSREAMETLVDKSETVKALQEPVARREDLPPDLLNEMYFFVSTKLREHILKQNQKIDEKQLEAALAASSKRLAAKGLSDEDLMSDVEARVEKLIKNRQLSEGTLVKLLKKKQMDDFHLAFARLAEMDVRTVRRLVSDQRPDGLAIVCRALGFERSTYSVFVLNTAEAARRDTKISYKAIDLYGELSVEAAQRTMRFWRVRQNALEDGAAKNAAAA